MRTLIGLFLFLCLAGAQAQSLNGASGAPPQGSASFSASADSATDVDALLRVLENDTARKALIARLKAASPAVAAAPDAPTAAADGADADEPMLARQMAEYTRDFIEQSSRFLAGTGVVLGTLQDALVGTVSINPAEVWAVTLKVATVVLVCFAMFFLLRQLQVRLVNWLGARVAGKSWLQRLSALLLVTFSDALGVLLAWACGYAFVIGIELGGEGRMGLHQTLFLNAFVIIELIKVIARGVLLPQHRGLRLIALGDTDAAYWYFWLSRIVSLLGYTFLFIAPILASNVSWTASRSLRVLVAFTAVMMVIAVVLQNRHRVRELLLARARASQGLGGGRGLALLARVWHLLAILYVVSLFVVWLSNPFTALPFMLGATVQSLLAAGVGALLSAVLARIIAGGMHLPSELKQRLPLLEDRLNAFIPGVLRVVRFMVMLLVLIAIGQAWTLIDFAGWIDTLSGRRTVGAIVSAGVVIVLGGFIYIAMSSWVEYRLEPPRGRQPSPRERTLLTLFRNAFTIALVVIVCMLALSELGVNIAPLLAGAGVLGLAIGFGSQKLVQDIITGAFIQLENAMNVGDVVTVGGISGVVEKLTIRSAGIRDLNGVYHIVPFSAVDTVSNFMRYFSYHVAEIGVAYRENVTEVKAAMLEAFERLRATEHRLSILGEFEMHGLTEFADSAVKVRGRIKTLPGKQWDVGRAYNECIKTVFDERNIEIPFPHLTVYMGEDHAGHAPPLHLAGELTVPPARSEAAPVIVTGAAPRPAPL
ncbi:mechanosensitive ion channel domain-containing protein [Plasticicumulans acidivorans]|uniref:Small conductance mechanosensitive channel n=1 Tax=Plasticicumulans acidivorans TaxID=886464 RepID=A0A317MXX7_9GAMM|nr:mechanosensitive ion channel domain-containing protein [Plasticicumulans acidivorans]PWV60167.1 small conductance mechanosensitive channel [Plasticicumulans acidivorans]